MNKKALMLFFLKSLLKEHKHLVMGLIFALLGISLSQAAFLFGTKGFMRTLFSTEISGSVKIKDLIPFDQMMQKISINQESKFWKDFDHYEVSRNDLVWVVPGYFLVVGILQAVSHYYYQLSQQLLSLRISARYRDKLFAAILHLPYLTQKAKSPAQWMSFVMNDVAYLQSRISDLTTAVVKDSVIVVVSFISLWLIHWPTALVLSLIVPILGLGMGRAGRKVTIFAEGFQVRLARLAASVHDWRQRFEFVVCQGGQAKEYERFKNLADEYFYLMNRSLMIRAFFAPSLEWLGFLFLCVLLILVGGGFWSAFKGEDLLQLMVALGLLMKPVKELGEQLARYHETKGILKSSLGIFRQIESEKELVKISGNIVPQKRDGIKIDHLMINVGSKTLFRSDTILQFSPGESFAVIGPSGAGKTSLMKCLAGLIEPRAWEADIAWPEIVRQTSFVSQDPFLFNDTIKNNLVYGKDHSNRPNDKMIWDALEFVGLKEEVSAFSRQLDTPVLAFSHNVSGGQLQRLVIARAILWEKRVLLLDEATSAIDAQAEKKLLMLLLAKMRENGGILIAITHRIQWLSLFDKVLFVEDGRVTMNGSYATLCREERFQAFCRAEMDAHSQF